MPFRLSGWELILILAIILLLFGPGRIAKIAGELGNSIRSFRKGVKSDEEKGGKEEKKEGADLLSRIRRISQQARV